MRVDPAMAAYRLLAFLRRFASQTKAKLIHRGAEDNDVHPSGADEEGYRKIAEIVPNLVLYKDSTLDHLCRMASRQGCANLDEYHDYLLAHDDELESLKMNLTLIGTNFFRGDDWGYFSEACLSHFRGRESVKVWCAGCSSGKEVYSVILSLLDYVDLGCVQVLATDYNDDMVAACRRAVYPCWELDRIPRRYLKYVEPYSKGLAQPEFTFDEAIKAVVTVGTIDLLTDEYPVGFDVILCRNVLKFFEPSVIPRVQERLVQSLNDGGFLFVATDDNHGGKELIKDPAGMGVVQMDGRCIYRKG